MAGIPWIPILSTGASLLGSLFGNQKNQSQSENSNTLGTSTVLGQTKLNSSTTQNTNQQQTSSQQSGQSSTEQVNTTQQQTGVTNRLDSETLGSLTDAVRQALSGKAVGAGGQAAAARLSEVQNTGAEFDADAYVRGIMEQTSSRLNSDLESGGNKIKSTVGARGGTNSAAALLEAKLNQQGAAELAGVNSQAVATAAEIKRQEQESKTGQITNLAAQTDSQIGNILGALLQATETQSQTAVGSQGTVGSTAGTTTGSTSTTGSTTETTSQTQDQKQATNSAESTIGSIKANSGSTNWSDFFTSIGKIFSSGFNNSP